MPTRSDLSTTASLPETTHPGTGATWLRRAFLALVAVVVLAGIFGVFGVRSRTLTARSTDGRTTLQVTYAQVARAGLDVPFDIVVHRVGGFHGDLVLELSSHYLDLFDESAVEPQPDRETSTSSTTRWHFSAPPTDTFTVAVDLQVQKGRHWGRSGAVAVLDHGRTVARATFTTWLAP